MCQSHQGEPPFDLPDGIERRRLRWESSKYLCWPWLPCAIFLRSCFWREESVCACDKTLQFRPSLWNLCDTELIMANIISLSLHNEAEKVSQSTKTVEARQGMFAFLEAELLWYCCRAFIVWQWNASFNCFSCDWQKWKLKTIQEKREIKTKLISTYGFVITSYFLVSLCAVHLCVTNSLYTLEDFKIKCMP